MTRNGQNAIIPFGPLLAFIATGAVVAPVFNSQLSEGLRQQALIIGQNHADFDAKTDANLEAFQHSRNGFRMDIQG